MTSLLYVVRGQVRSSEPLCLEKWRFIGGLLYGKRGYHLISARAGRMELGLVFGQLTGAYQVIPDAKSARIAKYS